jgi:hypothetical protein
MGDQGNGPGTRSRRRRPGAEIRGARLSPHLARRRCRRFPAERLARRVPAGTRRRENAQLVRDGASGSRLLAAGSTGGTKRSDRPRLARPRSARSASGRFVGSGSTRHAAPRRTAPRPGPARARDAHPVRGEGHALGAVAGLDYGVLNHTCLIPDTCWSTQVGEGLRLAARAAARRCGPDSASRLAASGSTGGTKRDELLPRWSSSPSLGEPAAGSVRPARQAPGSGPNTLGLSGQPDISAFARSHVPAGTCRPSQAATGNRRHRRRARWGESRAPEPRPQVAGVGFASPDRSLGHPSPPSGAKRRVTQDGPFAKWSATSARAARGHRASSRCARPRAQCRPGADLAARTPTTRHLWRASRSRAASRACSARHLAKSSGLVTRLEVRDHAGVTMEAPGTFRGDVGLPVQGERVRPGPGLGPPT